MLKRLLPAVMGYLMVAMNVAETQNSGAETKSSERSFYISYEKNVFMKDEAPYRFISGSIHYFRVPRELWRDRLSKMKLAGLTAIQTYVEWSSHQPSEKGPITFSGNTDICAFLDIAAELGLDVILRPGPYIDAERDFGGLPFWLLRDKHIKLRSPDSRFLEPVEKWFSILFRKLNKYLYKNGGPIIMVQLENEYGSYGCDKEYLIKLRDLLLRQVGNNVVLFSTDGDSAKLVNCTKIDGVYATVDFGPSANITQAFQAQRSVEPAGPLVNSEFYSGWLDHWQHKHSAVPADSVATSLARMLEVGASVNIYMFHGGTSFGLTAGSNAEPFASTPTSYDYDAPISESGDVGEKFWKIREVIGNFRDVPAVPRDFVNVSEKANYGDVRMHQVWRIFDHKHARLFRKYGSFEYPPSFEDLNQFDGFLLYQTKINHLVSDPSLLSIPGLADRAYLFINHQLTGLLARGEQGGTSLPLQLSPGDTLSVLVENQGRICFGPELNDRKGIIGNVSLGGHSLTDWSVQGLPLDQATLHRMHKLAKNLPTKRLSPGGLPKKGMSLWVGQFGAMSNSVAPGSAILDTFVKLPGWRKGVLIVNNRVLGRYWPAVGPQLTLYLPAPYIRPGTNTIMVLEQEEADCWPTCLLQFKTRPEIDGPTPFAKMGQHFEIF